MSDLVYPALPGLLYPVLRKPGFTTVVRGSLSQREVRAVAVPRSLVEIELQYEMLTEAGLLAIMGLYLRVRGGFDTFLYDDPSDNRCVLEPIGTGDGVATHFALQRNLGASARLIDRVNAVGTVYLNATPAMAYSVSLPRNIVFATPPAPGVSIKVSFTYYWRVRFMDDGMAFDEFMHRLYATKTVKLRSVIV